MVSMFNLLCTCPLGSEISDLTLNDCDYAFGETRKCMFQRVYSSGSTKNSLTISSANPNLLASWSTLLAASNGTKVVVTPFIYDVQSEPGEKREGQFSLGGIPRVLGNAPTPFSFKLVNYAPLLIEQLKQYQCETALGVYFVNEFGKIIGLVDDNTTPTKFYPIPLSAFRVSDRAIGGYDSEGFNQVDFMLLPEWSNKLYWVTPSDFDALTELAN